MDVPEAAAGEHPDNEYQLAAQLLALRGEVASLGRRAGETEAKIESVRGAFDELENELARRAADRPAGGSTNGPPAAAPATPAPGEPDSGGEGHDLDMRRLVPWVRDNVALLLQRHIPQTNSPPYWCHEWWRHPEAIARFEAVRRSWEEASVSPGNAMVVYFEHVDAMLGVLCGENGPFCRCTKGTHNGDNVPKPLGHEDPPEAYFVEFEQAQHHYVSQPGREE